jgi:starvation-inducible DNA-binding protein
MGIENTDRNAAGKSDRDKSDRNGRAGRHAMSDLAEMREMHEMRESETRSKLGAMNLGLLPEARIEVCSVLNRVLSDSSVLLAKTRKAHWDIVGPQFYSLHKLWDEQYERISERVDQIAERIRMLGGYPIGTMAGWLELATLREAPGRVSTASNAVTELVLDHELVVRTLREQVEQVDDEYGDIGTADFLTDVLQDHEQMAWMLRSFLQGEAVEPTDSPIALKSAVPRLA